ncbi:MAG: hypothetical protein JNL67_09905 [Planctomycetaceae bacterium]|nr:hypothetical protein [Planctomycetaceae bacterium]
MSHFGIRLSTIAFIALTSTANAQVQFQRIAQLATTNEATRPFSGGRKVEFSPDNKKVIAAFFGSTVQLFDLEKNVPIGEPIRTAGDGEVGFVNDEVGYTADWKSLRLWDANTGQQIGDSIPHQLREDTVIQPAIHPTGRYLATRATMTSVHLWNVADRRPIAEPMHFSAEVQAIRFSDDGLFLFVNTEGTVHAIGADNGKTVAGPIASTGLFQYFPKQQRLVTTEQTSTAVNQLVVRSTDQQGWPETHRATLSGTLVRFLAIHDDQVLVHTTKNNRTPELFAFRIDEPETRIEIETTADRAFGLVVPPDSRYWISTNIRDIKCQEFGKSEPLWQKQIPPSGFDQHLYPLDNEHFAIRDKQEHFSIYKVADGSEVWRQAGVKQCRLTKNLLALCKSDGVEIWRME